MNNDQLTIIIGPEIPGRNVIAAGRYGDCSLHENKFVTGDPCYFGDEAWMQEFRTEAIRQQPAAYAGRIREWVEVQFRGSTCYFITCGDGTGPFGHCVDAGWVVAIPLALCPKRIQDLFPMRNKTPFELKFPKFLIGDSADDRTFVVHLHHPRFVGEVRGGVVAVIEPEFIDPIDGVTAPEIASLMRQAGDFYEMEINRE